LHKVLRQNAHKSAQAGRTSINDDLSKPYYGDPFLAGSPSKFS